MRKNISNISIKINGREVIFEAKDKYILCSSLDVSRVFEKRHSDVLELINEKKKNNEIESFTERNFRLSKYVDKTGRTLPCYKLTRDGFSFIAMGLTGRKADSWKVLFIKAFNKMERMLKEYEEDFFLAHTQKEVFNLIYKTPCRNAILEEIKKQEEEKQAKCVKVNQYRIEEIFNGSEVKITTEIQLDFDKSVQYELNKPKIEKRMAEIEAYDMPVPENLRQRRIK